MTMRERLAAAFCGWDYADWQDFPLLDREVALRGVDRMLAVLREPNEAMDRHTEVTLFGEGHRVLTKRGRRNAWQAGIDAILQDGE